MRPITWAKVKNLLYSLALRASIFETGPRLLAAK